MKIKFLLPLILLCYIAKAQTTGTIINVKDHGAVGDGVHDDTDPIRQSLILAGAGGTVYFPSGTYSIQELGASRGIIVLRNGVNMQGSGPANCHIKLSGGRTDPKSIFYQDYTNVPSVSNVTVDGIDFDGSIALQTFASTYQYCHAFSINNGSNIEVRNCKFQAFRGDGVLFGDTDEPTLNQRVTSNVNIHDNEFVNIYREGAMFCCTKGGSFFNNYVHGDGYLVGGVDIERHSANEAVLNISVYNNVFDFRDGNGPIERGAIIKYRRGVTMGYFYTGYPGGVADTLSGGHKVYNNTIYQGQIDCFGPINVIISNNTITNTYENITGVTRVSGPSINVSDSQSNTLGLTGVYVTNNVINSLIVGQGISFKRYANIIANNNTITNTPQSGIYLVNSSGIVNGNKITDVGTAAARVSGIGISANAGNSVVSNNTIKDTKSGTSRSVSWGVYIDTVNPTMAVSNNIAVNLYTGIIGGQTATGCSNGNVAQ